MALKHSSALLLAAFVSLTSALTHAAPTINTHPSSATPAFGSTITLSASATAEPGATFAWMRDGTTQIINGGRYSGATTGTLTISGANVSDNGSYTLTVTDGTGSTPTNPATINVPQAVGSLDPAYTNAGSVGNNTVVYTNNVVHLPDGRTLLAVKNQFNGVTGTAISNLVVMSATGVVSHPGFNGTPDTGASFNGGANGGEVTSIFRLGNGKILVAGDFTTHSTDTVVNTPRNKVARLNANLTLDTSFVANGPSAKPNVIFADSYGRIYIGGNFFNYDAISGFQFLVRLREDGTLDQSFKPILNGAVNNVVIQKDGKFIVGGSFNSYGAFPSTSVAGLMRFNADGSIDTGYAPALPATSTVQNGLALDDADNLYVARSNPNVSITKLLPDGSAVSGFNFLLTPDAPLGVLAVQPGGKLAMGGTFTTPASRLFRLNTIDASPDTNFGVTTGITIASGFPEIYGLSSDAIGRLWVTGKTFSHYNGSAANRFAVIQGSGGPQLAITAHPTGGAFNQASSVSLTAHATGNNGFTYLWHKNGSPLSNGGRFSGVDTNTLTINPIEAGDEAGFTLVVSSPGATSVTSRVANIDVLGVPEITRDPTAQTVDFGGSLILTAAAAGATPLTYRWYYGTTPLTNGTGVAGATTDSLILTNIDFNDAGQYSLKASNGLGDDTSAAVTLTVQKRPGGIAASSNPLPMFNGEVNAIALLPDGSYVVGGGFDTVSMNGGLNFNSRSCLMRVLANGTLDTSFPTAAGAVHAVEVDSAGKIFIGGGFSSVTANSVQTNRVRVARLIASGSSYVLDSAFDTSTVGPNQNVFAIAPVGDGSAFIGGDFTQIGSTTTGVTKMARLNANGTVNTAFVSGANNTVHKLSRRTDGSLYVAGLSNRWGVAEFAPRGVILVSATGARNTAFVPPGTGTPYFPGGHALLQLADGALVAGLNWAGGNPYAVRMNGSTGALATFNSTHGTIVTALDQQSDGKLLIGGSFGYFTRNSPTDGTVDTTMNIGTGFVGAFTTPKINAIKVDSNGRIFVVGNFTHYDGSTRNRFVILNGGDLDSRTTPKPGQTITFADIADRAFVPANAVANTITITLPTSSSLLPVTTVVTSGPATLVGNKLTFIGAGSVVLTASQAGNDNFMAASVSQTIEVSKAAQTLTFAPLIDRPNTSAPFFLSAATSSGLPVSYTLLGGPATLSGNRLSLNGATGTVTIRASQPGNADFDPTADIEQSFEVFEGTPALLPQTIVFGPQSPRSANEDPFPVFAAATSGLPVDFTISGPANIAGNLVTLTGVAGSVVITASQPGNANFLPAIPVKQTIKVGPAATSLTLTNLIQTYTGNARIVDVVGGTADSIFYTVNKVKGTTPPTAAGSYPVEAVSGTLKKTGTLVVNKAPLLVVADDKRKFIGQINPPLTFAYSGFLGSDHAGNAFTKAPTITTKATTTSPGGDYPITPAGGAAANYALVYVNGNLKVESWAGQYEAILTDGNTNLPSAKIEFTVSAGSRDLTGKLTTAKQSAVVPFKGSLGLDFGSEYAMADISAIVGKGDLAVVYNIRIDIPLNAEFSVTVTRQEGGQPAVTLGAIASGKKLQLYSGKPPMTYAGAYTLIFAPDTTVSALPKPTGSGFATAAIDAKGKMTFAGALADGTKITASLLPDADAGYRLYLTPYTGRLDSYCAAWFEPQEHPDLPGRGIITLADNLDLYWAKAAPVPTTKDANYRDGIPESACAITLDPWLPPATKPTVITLPTRLVLNSTGDIEPVFESAVSALTPSIPTLLRMDSKGLVSVNLPAVTPANPSGYKVTVTAATGAFVGSFNLMDGSTKRLVNFSGVLRQTPLSETSGAIIGAGFGIVPQLTGQSAGTTSTSISFERP